MAITPIQVPTRQPKKDAMDRILQGLQIANEVFKIPVAYESFKSNQAERGLREQDLATKQRLSRNEYTPQELAAAKLIPAKDDDPNGFDVQLVVPNGALMPRRVKPQADLSNLENQLDVQLKSHQLGMVPLQIKKLEAETAAASRDASTPKEPQAKAAGFATRADSAHQIALELEGAKDFDPASLRSAVQGISILPNKVKDPKLQQYEQAKSNFITAVLRQESGANITPKEFKTEEAKYFPQYGDAPETLAQKATARQQAIENLKTTAGDFAVSKVKKAAPQKTEGSPGASNQTEKLVRPNHVAEADWNKVSEAGKRALMKTKPRVAKQ